MRTGLFLIAGILMMAASLLLGRLFAATHSSAPLVATLAFAAAWLVIAAANMWIGVAKAGYSVAEELPIFGLIFLLPVAVAITIKWKVL